MKHLKIVSSAFSVAALFGLGTFSNSASADIIHADDVIAQFNMCVGNDCVNGESFNFDTLRIKESNTRLHFDDTSTSASFPRNDWRLIANDSSNGGASYLAIEDATAGNQPFRVDAGAGANALRVDAQGQVGIGKANPVTDLHIATGNTPTVRLEQDGTSGFTSQTWDMAGNETNFFIRDVTNGSTLPFRIRPGAPTSSIFVDASGNVGMGAGTNPTAAIHVKRTVAGVIPDMLKLENNGDVRFQLTDTAAAGFWRMSVENAANQFVITRSGTGAPELKLTNLGDLEIRGGLTANVGTTNDTFPDYVFERNYPLMELSALEKFISKNKHLPNVPSKADVSAKGGQLNMTTMQLKLLEKVEELTLYTLQQQRTIDQQKKSIDANSELKARLASLEKLVTNLASSNELNPDKGTKIALKK